MAQYQTFPDAAGDSRTQEKLEALKLPDLTGRSFLDVGCNEGFFCGFAKFLGAQRSIGLDHSKLFIERARQRFPDCEFRHQGWEHLPKGPFDVILLASALHYAEDQPGLVHRLVEKLLPDGVLVLEMGIVSSPENAWLEVERGIDRRTFPTMAKLREILDGYAWKWMGKSVPQDGDPVEGAVLPPHGAVRVELVGQRAPVVVHREDGVHVLLRLAPDRDLAARDVHDARPPDLGGGVAAVTVGAVGGARGARVERHALGGEAGAHTRTRRNMASASSARGGSPLA